MKNLNNFLQKKKIAKMDSIKGGLAQAELSLEDGGTRQIEQCQCSSGHWHNDHVSPDPRQLYPNNVEYYIAPHLI